MRIARALLLVVLFAGSTADSAEPVPHELRGVGITEHYGERIPLDLEFIDSSGRRVALREHFEKTGKPVILTPVYYTCPMICNMTLNGLNKAFKELDWTVGDKFEVVTVSIDPTETADLANVKKANYLAEYGRPEGGKGWHWYVGEEPNIKKLADAIGFEYRYDERRKEYAHSPAIMVLTPDGRLSRYFYGMTFNPKDLRMALLEASEGSIGSTLDKLILFCYHYDPISRTYGIYAMRVMQLGGGVSVLLLGSFIGLMLWRERHRRALLAGPDLPLTPPVGS